MSDHIKDHTMQDGVSDVIGSAQGNVLPVDQVSSTADTISTSNNSNDYKKEVEESAKFDTDVVFVDDKDLSIVPPLQQSLSTIAPSPHKLLTTSIEPQYYTLIVHSVTRSSEDIIFSPELLRDWYLSHEKNSHTSNGFHYVQLLSEAQVFDEAPTQERDRLVLRVPPLDKAASMDDVADEARVRLEISISSAIAEAFGLVPFGRVLVRTVPSSEVEMNFVELVFKRQFLQRGNIWRFNKSMISRTVFVGQTINVDGVQATIQELACKGVAARSGMVSNNTQVIFRSRSTRIIWLVQISSEMWEYDQAGDLYYEKFLSRFVGPLLDRWNALSVSHSLSVVFFSRTLFANGDTTSAAHGSVESDGQDGQADMKKGHTNNVHRRASDGVYYQDFFKVVIENNLEIDKIKIIQTLKQEFWEFPRLLKWQLGKAGPSDAASGNTLEAINTTLNLLDKHHMDRDLVRTGNSIVMLSASTAFFKVNPWMVQITKQRMMDSGIGLDFVSLSQPPLHVVPLFLVDCTSLIEASGSKYPSSKISGERSFSVHSGTRSSPKKTTNSSGEFNIQFEDDGTNGTVTSHVQDFYEVPHWI